MIAREHAPKMPGKVIEQAEFGGGGGNGLTADRENHGGGIDGDVSNLERTGRKRALKAAEYRLDTGYEFARTERFRDVIVSSDLKTEDAVGFTAFGGEKNHRHRSETGSLADSAAEFESVFARDHDVEHEERGTLAFGIGNNIGPAGIDANGKTIVLQVVANEAGDIGIVFNDEDAGFHGFIVAKGVVST
jgi:hypothetical protein